MDEKKIAFTPKMYFPKKIIVGSSLKLLADEKDKKTLVICSSFIKDSLGEELKETFGEKAVFEIQKGEPQKSDINRLEKTATEKRIESIVAIGGGSVIDTAKFIKSSLGVELTATPTTIGSGTEVSQHAVYTEGGVKKTMSSYSFLPETVILDSDYLISVPYEKSKYHLVDALAHSLESLASRFSNAFSDIFSLNALKTILKEHPALKNTESGRAGLENLQLAGVMAGLAQSSAGTGLTHALAHYYGAKNGIPHAEAISIFLRDVIWLNIQKTDKYKKMDSLKDVNSGEILPALEDLYAELNITSRKIITENVDTDAEIIRKDINTLTNPYLPSSEEIKEMIKKHL